MKEYRLLNELDLNDVSGGFGDREKYRDEEYYEAGIIIAWRKWNNNEFYFCMPGNLPRHKMNCYEADSYVEYYKGHTPEEYIKHVQEVIPDYTQIIMGRSINR